MIGCILLSCQDISLLCYVLLPSGPWVLKIYINDCSKLKTAIVDCGLWRVIATADQGWKKELLQNGGKRDFFAATQKRAKQKEREIAVACRYLGRRRLPRSAGHLA